ncbi:MAG: hypothetical protein IKU01_01710 [Bacteroidales bacterium]|nr:hypothetical protein [Bacteroidales bacterium]
MSKSDKQAELFIQRLSKLNAIEVVGVAKMLGVEVIEGEKLEGEHREFHDVLGEMIENFCGLGRRQRRNLLKIMDKAGKE